MGGTREGERKFEARNLDKIDAFLRPSNLKTVHFSKKNSRVGYVCIEESFDNIFNVGYWEAYSAPPPVDTCDIHIRKHANIIVPRTGRPATRGVAYCIRFIK